MKRPSAVSLKGAFATAVAGCLLAFLTIGIRAMAEDDLARKRPHIVFLVSEDPDNYEAHRTVPAFAAHLKKVAGYDVTVLSGSGPRKGYQFHHPEMIDRADVLVIFCRRLALPYDQMDRIRTHLAKGKPLVGIRTANHAFSVREEVLEGYTDWWDFVPDVLGCRNNGYGPVEPGTDVTVVREARRHPVLKNLDVEAWHSAGNLYLVSPLHESAEVLLTGRVGDQQEPIAWTRVTDQQSRVFYTSLGYPEDFEMEQFRQLLINAIDWALDRHG